MDTSWLPSRKDWISLGIVVGVFAAICGAVRNPMPTIQPQLSILVPALWSRQAMLATLLPELERQAEGKSAEIVCVLDNRTRSIGFKRQSCLDIARGQYIAFVDDDDDVAPTYVDDILAATAARASVIVFNQISYLENCKPITIRFGLEYQNESVQIPDPQPDGLVFHRRPWHVCAWRRDIAQRCIFPDASYGEDWWWAAQCNSLATRQARIDKVLHTYRHHSNVTAAEPVFPPKKIPVPRAAPRRSFA